MPVDPAALHIACFPAAILRSRAAVVPRVGDDTRGGAQGMVGLTLEAEGIGLAAPQVGLRWRMFVVHVPASENRPLEAEPALATASPLVFIDPVLSDPVGAPEGYDEGCLSLPEITGEV